MPVKGRGVCVELKALGELVYCRVTCGTAPRERHARTCDPAVGPWSNSGSHRRPHIYPTLLIARENAGREASPTTAIIDSQTAKGAVKGGLRSTHPAMTLARRCLAASATF